MAPSQVLAESPRMIYTMHRVLAAVDAEADKQRSKRKRR